MKGGEYLEHQQQQQRRQQQNQQPKHDNNTHNMFAKFQPHHQHHTPLPPPPPPAHHHFPFSSHFQLSRESEDDDARTTTTPTTNTYSKKPPTEHNSSDGATIEVVRRPRGRPPGSKNKPKPPLIITRDNEPAMSPYILEVPGGNDVVEAIFRFSRRKDIGICVLTASGTVANVTLRQPSATPGATITFHGRFDILSISATFLPQTAASFCVPNTFTISLAGPQGQIVGGIVAGELVAAGTVFVVAVTICNPSFHRLLAGEEEGRNNSGSGGGAGEGQSPALSGAGAESVGHAQGESCGIGMYSCHLPSDVICAPTAARPPQPLPPPY